MLSILSAMLTAILTVGLGIFAFEYQQRWHTKLKYYELTIRELEGMSVAGKQLIMSNDYEIYISAIEDESIEK